MLCLISSASNCSNRGGVTRISTSCVREWHQRGVGDGNERCTYVWDASDIGPERGSCAANEADVRRLGVVEDYVDSTTSNLAYFVFSRWPGCHGGRMWMSWALAGCSGLIQMTLKWVNMSQKTKDARLVVAHASDSESGCLSVSTLNIMAESSSSIDSSFVLIGTEQSQVLPPSRPPTVTSDTTFPSSISTPTSPLDSNVSFVGTLEVVNHSSLSIPLRLTAHIFSASTPPFCRLCVCRGIDPVLRPRLVPRYDRWHSYPRQAFRRRIWARVQPSWGEPLGELQDVRPLVKPFCVAAPLYHVASAARLTTTMPHFLLAQKQSLSSDGRSRWTRRRSISRGFGVGVSPLVSSYICFARAFLLVYATSLY